MELWIKKTIWRRYLINDDDMKTAKKLIKEDPENAIDTIEDCLDTNLYVEYDNEETVFPIDYTNVDVFSN